ncbi:amidohydrolase family protein [Pimelobacter simplex]|uniref:Uncharacterized protein n=1 Tax=Nocardioides simplex TaxID=2045 RepID=A0A0A1DRM4_NOCSI|nr:amidohydrolase family protein [Pimelobacter simplex]AIY19287.1 hypothetical protein KR76_25475 [Pimelobacter simplex]MCG8149385.1 amidohydrolase family protein [Pimelobacter simplex]GEB16489.1 amidohydrolase [Pimelobacter simplex]SFM19785.1 hypothetical protein SAMN05421671_0236 [Pimelobacter simplex]
MTYADQVVLACRVHPMAPDAGVAEAVAVRGDRIEAVGSRAQARAWIGPGTTVTDHGSGVITPGLVDAHSHPVLGLRMTAGADLTGVTSPDELRSALATAAAATPSGAWIQAWGLKPDAWPAPGPHRSWLDAIVGDRPALVRFFDGHAVVASTRALELAGTAGLADVLGPGLVGRDAQGLTGVVREPAGLAHLDAVIAPADVADEAARLHALLAAMAATGLTTVHALDLEGDALAVLAAAEARGRLPVRLLLSPWCGPDLDVDGWRALVDLQRRSGERWAVRGVKLFLDGTIDHGTAWLSRPDRWGQSDVSLWPDRERYAAALAFFDRHGVATATHAIGDASVGCALDVIGDLRRAGSTLVHRIEHIETAPDHLLPRFAEVGAAACMQPTHCTRYVAADGSDNWSARLPEHQARQAWRTRDLRDLGAIVALGSDWPIAHYDPRQVMADAQERRPAELPDAAPVGPEQRLTARMALEGYTTHAAAADGLAAELGVLAPGARADLTVFAADPLELPPGELLTCPVLATYVGGVPTHRHADLPH